MATIDGSILGDNNGVTGGAIGNVDSYATGRMVTPRNMGMYRRPFFAVPIKDCTKTTKSNKNQNKNGK